MSLLQQNPAAHESASSGDELTKGSGHIVWASLIAVLVVTLAIVAYVVTGEKPFPATGEASNVVAHFMHTETPSFNAGAVGNPKEEFDQVLLFTHFKLHNQSKQPLFMRPIMTNVSLPDGVHTSYPATPLDYQRLFVAYKELAPLHGKPLAVEETIAPGDTIEGDIVSALRMTKQEFESRKGIDYTISFHYQPDMKLPLTSPITEK